MIDCVFEANRHVHMHVSEKRGAVTLVSRYTPGSTKSHSEDLRRGLESEGRIIPSRDHRLKSELFLLNDQFGEKPGEVVFVELRDDGVSRMEAKAVSGAIRQMIPAPARCDTLPSAENRLRVSSTIPDGGPRSATLNAAG